MAECLFLSLLLLLPLCAVVEGLVVVAAPGMGPHTAPPDKQEGGVPGSNGREGLAHVSHEERFGDSSSER